MLKKSLEQFGDLSGIIFNRRTGRLVGGHQRVKVLPPGSKIEKEDLTETSKTGTVALGSIQIGGDRFVYREVDWDETTEKAANIAANQHGGEWDVPQLADWLNELDSLNIDMDLTGFSQEEMAKLMAPNFSPGSAEEQGQLDQKQPLITQCPNCGECFNAHENKPKD